MREVKIRRVAIVDISAPKREFHSRCLDVLISEFVNRPSTKYDQFMDKNEDNGCPLKMSRVCMEIFSGQPFSISLFLSIEILVKWSYFEGP